MKNQKLKYVFHNPNSSEQTLEYVYKQFLKANEEVILLKYNEIIKESSK